MNVKYPTMDEVADAGAGWAIADAGSQAADIIKAAIDVFLDQNPSLKALLK